ncbi:MAG: hypothetical protein WAL50_18780 [Kineosporiaceae bacterium]
MLPSSRVKGAVRVSSFSNGVCQGALRYSALTSASRVSLVMVPRPSSSGMRSWVCSPTQALIAVRAGSGASR